MEENMMNSRERKEVLRERRSLVRERLHTILDETSVPGIYRPYFSARSDDLLFLHDLLDQKLNGSLDDRSLVQCRKDQDWLYGDLKPENYGNSAANPQTAVRRYGQQAGQLLSLLAAELYAGIGYAFEGRLEELVILSELFIEIFDCFAMEDGPDLQEAHQTIYWYFHDYSELFTEDRVRNLVDPSGNLYVSVIRDADLSSPKYLYRYGLPIGENELRTYEYLNSLPQKDIQAMADTFTEGYRIGFEVTGKDIRKKKTVGIHYAVGFERVMRAVLENFEKIGLQAAATRQPFSTLTGFGGERGVYSTSVNRQFDFDHRQDRAFYYDKAFVEHYLENLENAFRRHQEQAAVYGGPAVQEVFGELPFEPESKDEAIHFSDAQQQLSVYQMSRAGQITNTYIHGEERSFTIIDYPVAAIGPDYEKIFSETVRINTLDYKKYQIMQQKLIDLLDTAQTVEIRGQGGNETSLDVAIRPLSDPEHETAFENCVADVNIPVGEVFTTPKLEGTNGVLHVSHVYLNGLQFRDLKMEFLNGMVTGYTCANFQDEEENRKYIRDNVLMHHDTLPMGEFAIGTNTIAYRMARTYGIEDRLPILIAEKTGPHFAVGDTCYSHEEDTMTYNPDGKAIVARDNAITLKYRKSDQEKAYFNCHTDITIPFEELGRITVLRADGSRQDVIRGGQFVVHGTEELNEPLKR